MTGLSLLHATRKKQGANASIHIRNKTLHRHAPKRETGEVTLGLSAGGPLSRTEVASSGLKSKPKERGGWALCFGASLSTDHCDVTKMKQVQQIQRCKDCKSHLHECLFFNHSFVRPFQSDLSQKHVQS